MRFSYTLISSLSISSVILLISAFNSPPHHPYKNKLSLNNKINQAQIPTLKLQTISSPNEEKESNIFVLFEMLDNLYTQSNRDIKCPFFRRRAADIIDGFAMILRFLMIRHKSLYPDTMDVDFETFMIKSAPPGCRSASRGKGIISEKIKGLSVKELYDVILYDWTNNKREIKSNPNTANAAVGCTTTHNHHHHVGYYITGKLNNTIYRDDCLFIGPDPDMPVHGLRKYLSAASKLFHHKQSFADLLDLQIIKDNEKNERMIVAYWRIGGVIMLPWKPRIKPYTGKTEYYIDNDGLIYLHKETWDISVIQAFVSTMWPNMAKKIWSSSKDNSNNDRISISSSS